MKTKHLILLLFFCSLLLNSKCKKEKTEPQLPPETTIGAMTFGCKIDGKVFVPKGSNAGPDISAQYLFLGTGPGGGWWLNLSAANREEAKGVYIRTDTLLLLEGNSYVLKKQKGFPSAEHSNGLFDYLITNNDTGNLVVTKHDQTQRILSGRFSFTASRSTGEKVTITKGRFDIRY